jgi:hypothetical protein
MRLVYCSLFICFVGLFFSCEKNEPEILNSAPNIFSVVSRIGDDGTSITLSWNKAIDPDGDEVLYTVILEDTLAKDIRDTSFVIKNLGYDFNKEAYVIAKDAKGSSTKVSFIAKTKVDPGFIFIGIGGVLHAINPDNGEDRWIYNMGGGSVYNPVMYKDNLYVTTYANSGDNVLVIGKDGKLKKSLRLPYNCIEQPLIQNDTLYILSSTYLTAFDLDLKTRWQTSILSYVDNRNYFSISDKFVIWNSLYNVKVFNKSDGKEHSSYGAKSGGLEPMGPSKIINGMAYFTGVSIVNNSYLRNRVYCLDIEKKSLKWNVGIKDSESSKALLQYNNELLLTGGAYNTVYQVNMHTGTLLNEIFINSDSRHTSPTVKADTLYGSSQSGAYAYDLVSKKQIWKTTRNNSTTVSASVLSKNTLTFLHNEVLVSLDKDNGRILWERRFINDFQSYSAPVYFDGESVWYTSSNRMYKEHD